MTKDNKPFKVVFEPGCFDNWEGSQQGLDELVEEIKQVFSDPDFLESLEDIVDVSDLTDDEQAWFNQVFDNNQRKLN